MLHSHSGGLTHTGVGGGDENSTSLIVVVQLNLKLVASGVAHHFSGVESKDMPKNEVIS